MKIQPLTWTDAFKKEIDVVKQRHAGNKPVEKSLVGLAFSGGGIRSATFGLGVLEGLKKLGLLNKIDYLSTVSGGGYIGAWLSANCKRAAGHGETDWLSEEADWKESVDHLRRYSNYLSPKVGFFSADTWSMATIWMRNTILVNLTVILAIAVALLLPRPLIVVFQNWPHVGDWRWATICLFIFGVAGIAGNQLRQSHHDEVSILQGRRWLAGLIRAVLCLAIARGIAIYYDFKPFADTPTDYRSAGPIAILLVMAGFWLLPVAVKLLNRCWVGDDPPEQINYTQPWVQNVVVIPMMATGFLVAAIMWGQSRSGALASLHTFGDLFKTAWQYWPFPLSVVFASLWLLSFCSVPIRGWRDWKCILVFVLAPTPAMLVLHSLLCVIMLLLNEWKANDHWMAFIWAPAMVLYSFSLTIVMLIGILGRQSSEGVREWWSRFGAWLAIYGFAWMLINLVAAHGPGWSARLWNADTWKGMSVGGSWVGTVLAGLFAGKSGSTGGKPGSKGTVAKVLEIVAAVAPFVFIAGLLVGVATVAKKIIDANADVIWTCSLLNEEQLGITLVVLAALMVALLLLAARVDINEFGINAFYRSRLVRCYLGATRFREGERVPQNFTGFDDDDDLLLAQLTKPSDPSKPPAGPLHIINCALNLGGSSDLALHTRHSAVFTLSPICCGSRYQSRDQAGKKVEMGYTSTAEFGGSDGQPTLGQAISVSGAAASPNMGYHTSAVMAFMMTLFNVRLGWWFPNPRQSGINSPSPWFSLRYLFMELFGGADDKSKYLAISDGGHFENLAAYELVKRQCRVIVISDGECDPNLHFEGLGTLIRMCQVDFGAKITIDVSSIRRAGDAAWSRNRWAIGTIHYKDGTRGTLVYLKASMTGSEDTAILQYQAVHGTFPHESTSNQFYREDQFESYRSLGREIATHACDQVAYKF